MRGGQSLSASYRIKNSLAMSIRSCKGPQAATSGHVGTGMETWKVQKAVALGMLF